MTTESGASGAGASDLDLFEEASTGQPSTVQPSAIPSKYEGKTKEDLIKMHQNAERLISRQGEEVAQTRRMADEILQLKKPTTQTTEERKPVTVDALLNDPEKAIRHAVDGSDLVQRTIRAEERVQALEARLTESEFVGKHKTVEQDVNDPEFIAWVNKNSLRQALAKESASNSSNKFVAAKNLWDLWDEHKELVGASKTPQQRQRAVPSTVKSAPADTGSTGKVYSSAKLMELRMKVADGDPAAVARWKDSDFQANLIKAYAEGRVR